jgi:outer membrane protein OmpA-like peptidoglycan-associated protein
MGYRRWLIGGVAGMAFGILAILPAPPVLAAQSGPEIIAEARTAIEQARRAGAEQKAPDDLAQARSWLAQAEKQYDDSQSILSRTMKLVMSDEERAREILYLADVARTKARTAEMKAKKAFVAEDFKAVEKDLAGYRTSLEVLRKRMAEAEQARGVQARAEAELKALEASKQKASEFEQLKKKELAEAQRKAAEFEALKHKELQQARLEEAQRAAEREKASAEVRIKAERLALQREKDAVALRVREEKLAEERERMAAMEKRMAAMEREKSMLAEAAQIPQTAVRSAGGEIVLTLLAVNLFSPKNELHDEGKTILDRVGAYLKKHASGPIAVRGFTDSTGGAAINQTVSEKRAQLVKEYLALHQNISAADIRTEGLGPSQPAASNATEAGRALNRRVEIAVPLGR